MRTLVDIPAPDIEALDHLSKRRGWSRAGAIRAAIREYLMRYQAPDGDDVFGLWSDEPVDGLDYETRLRGEW